jgi:adenylate cyclase
LSLASRLTVLDISNNRLEQLEHADLDRLHSLVSIKMSNNKLTHLPSYFGHFKSLRSLNVSSNFLKGFPDFLCDLKSLVDLDISFNSIASLPKIGQLSTLERLWATNNMLSGSFPDNFKGLVNLKEIDIRFNGIASIDIVSQLPRLEQLMVGHNAISVFEGFSPRSACCILTITPSHASTSLPLSRH